MNLTLLSHYLETRFHIYVWTKKIKCIRGVIIKSSTLKVIDQNVKDAKWIFKSMSYDWYPFLRCVFKCKCISRHQLTHIFHMNYSQKNSINMNAKHIIQNVSSKYFNQNQNLRLMVLLDYGMRIRQRCETI